MYKEVYKDKTALSLYYTFRTEEFSELTFEEIGILTMALLELDETGNINEEVFNKINEKPLLRVLFKEMSSKVKRASEKWYEIQQRFEKARLKKKAKNDGKTDEEILREIHEQNKYKTEKIESNEEVIYSSPNGDEFFQKEYDENYIFKSFSYKNLDIAFYGKKGNIPKKISELTQGLKDKTEEEILMGWSYGNSEMWEKGWKEYF